jgi:GntR family transcriptional repressor for pyruvate dehydrogenase complex
LKSHDLDLYNEISLDRKGLHEQIADKIQRLVVEQEFQPGNKLPPERELAKMLNVSRPTVSEAMRLLQHRGLVDRRPGSGTYLIKMRLDALVEPIRRFISFADCSLGDLMQVRELLEPGAAALAAVNATPEDIEILKQRVEAIDSAFQSQDPEKLAVTDSQFHIEVANASGNELLAAITGGISQLVTDWLEQYTRHVFNEDNIKAHHLILEAIAERSPDRARQVCASHIQASRQIFLDFVADHRQE